MYTDQDSKIKQTKRNNDEIDLVELFKKFSTVFDRLGKFFFNIIILIKKQFIFLISCLALGALLGYGIHFLTKPYYTSSMTLVLSEIRNEFVQEQLNKLTEMIEDNNFDAISSSLKIDLKSAEKIKDMNVVNLDALRIEEDSILTGSPFRIELMLYDSQLFNEMEPALTNYLENNRYFTKQKRIRQRQVENLITKYKNEINSIDSLKTDVASPRGPVNGFVYGEALDPTNLYRESLNMYQQQVELEAELDQLDNIQVVTGFSPRSKPTGPNLPVYLVLGALTAFLIALIYASSNSK